MDVCRTASKHSCQARLTCSRVMHRMATTFSARLLCDAGIDALRALQPGRLETVKLALPAVGHTAAWIARDLGRPRCCSSSSCHNCSFELSSLSTIFLALRAALNLAMFVKEPQYTSLSLWLTIFRYRIPQGMELFKCLEGAQGKPMSIQWPTGALDSPTTSNISPTATLCKYSS